MPPIIKQLCFVVLIILYVLLIFQHQRIIRDTVDQTILPEGFKKTPQGLQTWVTGLVMFGTVTSVLNIIFIFFCLYRPLVGTWDNKTFPWTRRRLARTYYVLFNAMILLMCLAPILVFVVSPLFVTGVEWKREYKDACKGMAIIAALDSPKERPTNDIRFTNQTTNLGFSMSMNPIPMPERMDPNGVYKFSVTTSDEGASSNPSWTHIEYDLGHKRYRVLDSSNAVVQEGEYDVGEHFGIPKMGLQGNLSSFDAHCHWDSAVRVMDAEDKVVVKTAQFTMCGQLQACVDESLGDLAAVPVGLLVLQRAGRDSTCCGV